MYCKACGSFLGNDSMECPVCEEKKLQQQNNYSNVVVPVAKNTDSKTQLSRQMSLSQAQMSIGFRKVVYFSFFSVFIPIMIFYLGIVSQNADVALFFFLVGVVFSLGSIWFGRKVFIPKYAKSKGIKYID